MIVYDIQNLVKRYPGQERPANNDITLSIEQGEIFGILGENGAGKSTLVRQMVNLVRSTSGSIHLFGHDIARHPHSVTLNVGFMPQDGRALNQLTVGEALYFTAHLRGRSREEARKERDMLIELWQIHALRNKTSTRLSGGEKRLLQIAVAMAGLPPVLILDEPTNELDPRRRVQVWEVLLSLPSVIATILFGAFFLGVPLSPNPAIVVVLPLCAMPLAGVGAIIGTFARTPEEAGSISLLLTLAMLGLGPVIIAPDHLPGLLVTLGHFSPATYAASALRQTLVGPVTSELLIDLAVIIGCTIVTFWLAARKMDWRQR